MQAPLIQQTPSNLKSLHLLRSLLREASYLPDANARQYFHRYIVNRFRAYQPTRNASPSSNVKTHRHRSVKRRDVSIINERTRAMQRKGQKGLNYLRRANMGEHPCLQRILYFAYGRMGPRKYELLEDLLRPDEPTIVEEPAPLQKLYHSNERFLSFFAAPVQITPKNYRINISDRFSRLRLVLRVQSSHGVALHREIKSPYLTTPINNVWERSMPIKRAKGDVRRWYITTMTRLLPPLPNHEFDEIQAMAEGIKPVSLVKRRSPAIELAPEAVQETERFTKFVRDALALEKPSRADKPAGMNRPHRLTPLFMRRLYARVLTVCNKLVWNEKLEKWESKWGKGLRGMSKGIYSKAVSDNLFAGVDDQGRLLRDQQSTLPGPLAEEDERDPQEALNVNLEIGQRRKTKKKEWTAIPFYIDYLPLDHPVRKAADEIRKSKQ